MYAPFLYAFPYFCGSVKKFASRHGAAFFGAWFYATHFLFYRKLKTFKGEKTMFNTNYTAEEAIKGWAKFFYYCAIALPILSAITFFIFLGIDAEDLWWIGLIVFGGGLVMALPLIFTAHIV